MSQRNPQALRTVAFVAALTLALAVPLSAPAQERAGDEAALHQFVSNFTEGWNRHDARLLCRDLADDGEFVSWRGERLRGRQAYEDLHVPLFADLYKDTRRTDTVRSIRFLRPDLAIVDAYYTMTGARRRDGSDWPWREGYFSWLLEKRDGRWVAIGLHAADFNAPPPASGR